MDTFTHLDKVIEQEHDNGELPDNLVAPLRLVSKNPAQFSDRIDIVKTLIKQIEGFEPYCDCGCFNQGFNAKDVRKTLAQLGIDSEE